MKTFWTLIIMFLVLGALFIISNGNIHLSNDGELKDFAVLYYAWIIKIAGNIGSITGNTVASAWIPDLNSSLRE